MGAYCVIVHFGKYLDLSFEEAYNNMFSSLIYVLNQTYNLKTKILVEMTAGQGTETGYNIDGVSRLFNKFKLIKDTKIINRIGICMDTCHAFASGYNLKKIDIIKKFFKEFNSKIKLENLKLIHLNDSKVELGKKKDRHENLGKGFIGMEGLHYIYKISKKYKIPIVLETPNKGYKTEINKLLNFKI